MSCTNSEFILLSGWTLRKYLAESFSLPVNEEPLHLQPTLDHRGVHTGTPKCPPGGSTGSSNNTR